MPTAAETFQSPKCPRCLRRASQKALPRPGLVYWPCLKQKRKRKLLFPIASSLPLPPRPLPLLLCFSSSSSSTSRAGRLSFRAAAKTVGNASIPLAEVLADRRLLRGRGYALKCAWKTLKTASKRKIGRLPSSSSSSPLHSSSSAPPPTFLWLLSLVPRSSCWVCQRLNACNAAQYAAR